MARTLEEIRRSNDRLRRQIDDAIDHGTRTGDWSGARGIAVPAPGTDECEMAPIGVRLSVGEAEWTAQRDAAKALEERSKPAKQRRRRWDRATDPKKALAYQEDWHRTLTRVLRVPANALRPEEWAEYMIEEGLAAVARGDLATWAENWLGRSLDLEQLETLTELLTSYRVPTMLCVRELVPEAMVREGAVAIAHGDLEEWARKWLGQSPDPERFAFWVELLKRRNLAPAPNSGPAGHGPSDDLTPTGVWIEYPAPPERLLPSFWRSLPDNPVAYLLKVLRLRVGSRRTDRLRARRRLVHYDDLVAPAATVKDVALGEDAYSYAQDAEDCLIGSIDAGATAAAADDYDEERLDLTALLDAAEAKSGLRLSPTERRVLLAADDHQRRAWGAGRSGYRWAKAVATKLGITPLAARQHRFQAQKKLKALRRG